MRALASLVFIFIPWHLAGAQSISTAVLGTVRDATGAPVAGARVTTTSANTNFSRNTLPNDLGEYRIDFLPVGEYQVLIKATGFAEFTQQGVSLELNVPTRLDVLLRLETVNGTVTVTGALPIVDATTAEIGGTIENQEIVNCPLLIGMPINCLN